MLRMTEGYSKPIEKDLEYYFYKLYWKEILQAIEDPYYRLNANNALIDAIRKGTVQYSNGVFTGSFNMRTSSELDKFAKYDGRSKVWRGFPPPAVSAAASVANNKAKALNEKISRLIDDIPRKVSEAIDSLKYSIDAPLFAMNQQADKDISSLGLSIDVTPELSQRIKEDYTTNQNINIKNWTPEETERLRDMVEKNVLSGYNRGELIEMISSEYEVSMNKARFLARNETSLLMATVRDERYQNAGIRKYRWSATGGKSGDGRTRDLHRELHGKVFSYTSPPVIDERTGQTGNPGETYNCRCTAIPII